MARTRQRLAGIAAKRKLAKAKTPAKGEVEPSPVEVEPPKPRRDGLADLREAAQRRKAQAAA
jgi:hypothetical protein